MIDLHSHLLPGVDDGSANIETSVAVLERFARHGIEVLVCTPHLEASRAPLAPYAHHRDLLNELVAAAPPKPELRLGWEIMLDRPGCDLRAPELSLGGARAVLVEFPRAYLPAGSTQELDRIRRSGIVPVVAHPEVGQGDVDQGGDPREVEVAEGEHRLGAHLLRHQRRVHRRWLVGEGEHAHDRNTALRERSHRARMA